MKLWLIAFTVLAVMGVAVVLAVVLPFSLPSSPVVTPSITTSAPWVSVSVSTSPSVLFLDTFTGSEGVPLVSHVPDEPAGMLWQPISNDSVLYSQSWVLTGNATAAGNTLVPNVSPISSGGGNETLGSFLDYGYDPLVDTLRVRATVLLGQPTPVIVSADPPVTVFQSLVLSLYSTLGESLVFVFEGTYSVDNALVWMATVLMSTTRGGLPERAIQTTGTITSSPLAEVVEFDFTFTPQGHCAFQVPALRLTGEGPEEPLFTPVTGGVLTHFKLATSYSESGSNSPLYDVNTQVRSLTIEALHPDHVGSA